MHMDIHLAFPKVHTIFYVKLLKRSFYNLGNFFSEHHHLLASLSLGSGQNSRSNSAISLTPSARSTTSSNDSRMYRSSISSMTPPRFRSRSKSPARLPKILPRLPESVVSYDNLILGPLEQYLQFSNAIGQDVRRQAQMVKNLFEIQREFVLTSTGHDVNDRDHRHLTSPMGSGPAQASKMREIKAFASRHAYSPNAAHLYFISDTVGTLGWVVAGDRPSYFVREAYDSGKHHVKNIPGIVFAFSKKALFKRQILTLLGNSLLL